MIVHMQVYMPKKVENQTKSAEGEQLFILTASHLFSLAKGCTGIISAQITAKDARQATQFFDKNKRICPECREKLTEININT